MKKLLALALLLPLAALAQNTNVQYSTTNGGQVPSVVILLPGADGKASVALSSTNPLPVSTTGSTSTANQGTANTPANAWPFYLTFGGVALPLGQAAMASSVPVVLSSNQSNLPANLVQVGGGALALGQTVMASSIPVVLASNQTNVPTNLAQVGGTAVDTNTGNASPGTQRVVIASNQPALTVSSASTDPCQSSGVAKSSAPVAISTATTTQIVALSASKVIYVCNFLMTVAGTTPTVKFQYGTGSNCGTGTTDLTGAFAPLANGSIGDSGPGTIFPTAVSNALCILTGGTTPNAQGFVTYVQQ